MMSFDSTKSPVLSSRPSAAASSLPATSAAVALATASAADLPVAAGLSNGHLSDDVRAEDHHIWLVTGPAGTGKTTVAKHLAANLNIPYIEGDEFHPKTNIEKMRAGIPLTDADRWDWLTALREESMRRIAEGGSKAVVVTCSALKRKYRDVIRVAPYFNARVHLHFIFLHASEEVLLQRVAARTGHYMGAGMVHSQLDILEPPQPDEKDVLYVDVGRSLEEIEDEVMQRVVTITNAAQP